MALCDNLTSKYKRADDKGGKTDERIEAKTEGQALYMRAIEENRVIFAHGPAGVGKAQPLDAEIQTPDGPVTMGSLEVGDTICSIDGRTTKVLAIYPQGVKQTYLLTFDDGSTAEACGEHLWTVKDHRTGREETLSTLQISVARTYRPDGRSRFSIQSPGVVNFGFRETAMDPYLLGVLLGDGNITNQVKFTTADEEMVGHVKDSLYGEYQISNVCGPYDHCIKKGPGDGGINYYKQTLQSYDLMGLRSHEKFIPKHYIYNYPEVRLAVLQGLMDTDGWVAKNGKSQFFCTTSKQLSEDVVTIVESLGGMARTTYKTPTYTHNGEKHEGKLAYNISIRLPQGMDVFRLSRKREKYKGGKKYGVIRFIREVTPVRQVECQCILVDDPSHLYLTNHCIPTHNTFIASAMAAYALKSKQVERIICVRPAVGAGDPIGFLPGSADDKLMPYLRPIMVELSRFFPASEWKSYRSGEFPIIEIQPLEFMRGLTFRNAFVIADETQNASFEQVKMMITRLGKGTKMILNGDVTQSDLPVFRRGGFEHYSKILYDIPEVATIRMDRRDIVRDPLLQIVMERMEEKEHLIVG